ncbi:hypothetical protein EV10_0541 [Prochlorococcus marinus str. SS51]|nr:hypothetical protein [Prochlorococcus marinus]KGG25114.1 hypothetical protein EV09_0008 [Prochlorococcus marinus str. SS35]KGG33334.1 hypothetical protein EV10_0541 [Prochlorococcus marinus str. SS51]
MSVEDLTTFTKTVIEDQIKGTVGNEEEREAWKEMKEFLNEDFDPIVNGLKKSNTANSEVLKSPEEQELEKRKELLEKRKMESDQKQEDMW